MCDFGLSRFSTTSNLETLYKLRGTMAYTPPEVIYYSLFSFALVALNVLHTHHIAQTYFGERFTDVGDVFSIGIILWEITNRCIKGEFNRPYYEYPTMTKDFQIILGVVSFRFPLHSFLCLLYIYIYILGSQRHTTNHSTNNTNEIIRYTYSLFVC